MSRPLSAEERLLWRRVTADVRPSVARSADDVTPAAPPPAVLKRVAVAQPRPVPPPVKAVSRAKPISAATLDATWDRKLRSGGVEPDRVVDLHGLTADGAHRRAVDAIAAADRAGDRVVVLITGRAPASGSSRLDMPLRGIIRASIADWLAASPVGARIAAVRVAHRRHGGAGAIYVVLRRAKSAAR